MDEMKSDERHRTDEKLLLSVREAAALLSISTRTLWALSRPRGSIPVVGLGGRRLYSIESLREWIRARERGEIGLIDSTPMMPCSPGPGMTNIERAESLEE